MNQPTNPTPLEAFEITADVLIRRGSADNNAKLYPQKYVKELSKAAQAYARAARVEFAEKLKAKKEVISDDPDEERLHHWSVPVADIDAVLAELTPKADHE